MPSKRDPYAKLRRLVAKPDNGLHWYHAVGRCLLVINRQAAYGSHCVRNLAAELGQSHATFYRAMQFAALYTRKEHQELPALPWTSTKLLLTINDERLRRRLQRRAVLKRWSTRRLRREVNSVRDRIEPRGGLTPQLEGTKPDLERLVETSPWRCRCRWSCTWTRWS
jgi:hypothetical protein